VSRSPKYRERARANSEYIGKVTGLPEVAAKNWLRFKGFNLYVALKGFDDLADLLTGSRADAANVINLLFKDKEVRPFDFDDPPGFVRPEKEIPCR
jgi:hypothetical protein